MRINLRSCPIRVAAHLRDRLCDPQGVEVRASIGPQVFAAVAARPVARKRGSLSGSIRRCEVVASGSTAGRAKSVRTGIRREGSIGVGTRWAKSIGVGTHWEGSARAGTRQEGSARAGTRWEGSARAGTRREGVDTGVEAGTPCGCPLLSHRSRGVAPMTRGSGIASDPATPLGCRTDRLTDMCDTLAGSLKALLGDPQGVE